MFLLIFLFLLHFFTFLSLIWWFGITKPKRLHYCSVQIGTNMHLPVRLITSAGTAETGSKIYILNMKVEKCYYYTIIVYKLIQILIYNNDQF